MTEYMVTGYTLPNAYHKALTVLHRFGEVVPCPDYNTEQKELTMTMVVENPLGEPMISRCMIAGPRELEQYRQEMLDGILDFEVAKGNWPYTYHGRMENQIPFIVAELRRNLHSRRAVISLRYLNDQLSDDPACLQHVQYFVRDGKLHCKVLFRSNDACKAAFMNAFALIMLQERIAKELGVAMGSYTHRANSFHCYAKDYDMLRSYVARINADKDATYCYAGDWDEQMEEAKPEIAEMVAKLKGEGHA